MSPLVTTILLLQSIDLPSNLWQTHLNRSATNNSKSNSKAVLLKDRHPRLTRLNSFASTPARPLTRACMLPYQYYLLPKKKITSSLRRCKQRNGQRATFNGQRLRLYSHKEYVYPSQVPGATEVCYWHQSTAVQGGAAEDLFRFHVLPSRTARQPCNRTQLPPVVY